jgi:group I intron endonuclease
MGVIYKITNPSNKVYVGKTYDLRKRINSHKCSAKKDKNIILYNSIKKYGWENHKLEVIEDLADELLNEREMYWIKELNTYRHENPMGMNMTKGGDGQRSTWMHDVERRKRASIYFTENPTFKGKKHTDESKKIISEKASKRQKERGIKIPEWGVNKGRLKVMKPCVVYNNKGEFIREYDSLTNCWKSLNINRCSVTDSVIHGTWVSGKYLIKYKTDNYPLKIEVGVVNVKQEKKELLWVTNRKKVIRKYPSAKEASEELGIPVTTIRRAAAYNNGKPIRSGHVFIYG